LTLKGVKMEPKIMKLEDIPSKAVGGHDGFIARVLMDLPEKEMAARLIDVSAGGKGPVPPHSHPDTHFFIVIEGRLDLAVDETIYPVPSGHCAEVPPNSMHQLRCADDASMKILAIKWK
jgi:quercetin dioxygenase-like cupin family protein